MAAIVGLTGSVLIGANTVALLNDAEITPSADILDKTSFGDTWKTKLSGLKDWTAKASGSFDFTDTNGQKALWDAFVNGTTVSLKLTPDGTQNFTGTALVKSPPIKTSVDALVSVEFDFEGTGALTYSAT
jgi:predicted secreted protein